MWTIVALVLSLVVSANAQGVSLLGDSDFNASIDSADLRADAGGQDWYESRQDVPTLVTLDLTNVGGNATKKAKLTASTVGNAYLTQEFSTPQTQQFAAQWDIYVDSILDRPDSSYDRAAWVFIGDDTGTTPNRIGPNAEDSERFVYLGFYKPGGGTSGTMDLIARQSSAAATTYTTVATGLSLKRWYTIRVYCDLAQDTYEVYIDGQLQGTVKARTPKDSVTHISFAEWPQDEGAAIFYVDNVTAESSAADQTSDDRVADVAIQSDGKIVALGHRIREDDRGRSGEFCLARYNTDGSLDASFSSDGYVTTHIAARSDDPECVIIQPDGKIIAAGACTHDNYDRDFALVRYLANGEMDPSFGDDGIVFTDLESGSTDHIADIALQPDGKIVAVGMSDINGRWDFALARYDRFGNLDPTFSGDGKVITPMGTDMDMAESVAIRPDGKIVVVGQVWDEVNWDYEIGLARYNTDGSLDGSFSWPDGKLIADISGEDDYINSMVLQPDGKIVLAGRSDDALLVARYNPNGSRDASFMGAGIFRISIGLGGGAAASVALQPDGKIVAAGYSNSGDNYLDFTLVRCNADGSLDESFGVDGIATSDFASSHDVAYSVALQSDGKIVMAGYTAEFEPPEQYDNFDFALTRHNTDGSLDLSFSGDGKVTTDFP